MSLQNSSQKSISRTPEIAVKSEKFDSAYVNASTYLSNSRPQPVYHHSQVSSSSGTAIVAANHAQVLDARSSLSLLSSSQHSVRHSRSNSGVPKMNTEKRLRGEARRSSQMRKKNLSQHSPLTLIGEADLMRQFLS